MPITPRWWYIYKITNPNGRAYIGVTKNPHHRFSYYKNNKCKNQTALYHSLKKYGFSNHKTEIIDCFYDVYSFALEHNSIVNACKELKISHDTIIGCLKNKVKKPTNFIFKYK